MQRVAEEAFQQTLSPIFGCPGRYSDSDFNDAMAELRRIFNGYREQFWQVIAELQLRIP